MCQHAHNSLGTGGADGPLRQGALVMRARQNCQSRRLVSLMIAGVAKTLLVLVLIMRN